MITHKSCCDLSARSLSLHHAAVADVCLTFDAIGCVIALAVYASRRALVLPRCAGALTRKVIFKAFDAAMFLAAVGRCMAIVLAVMTLSQTLARTIKALPFDDNITDRLDGAFECEEVGCLRTEVNKERRKFRFWAENSDFLCCHILSFQCCEQFFWLCSEVFFQNKNQRLLSGL